jgi:hypothetical protein
MPLQRVHAIAGSQIRRELFDGRAQLGLCDGGPRRLGLREGFRYIHFVQRHARRLAASLAHEIHEGPSQDREEPGEGVLLVAECLIVPERPDVDLLHQIIGVEVSSAELPRALLQNAAVLGNQPFEGQGAKYR